MKDEPLMPASPAYKRFPRRLLTLIVGLLAMAMVLNGCSGGGGETSAEDKRAQTAKELRAKGDQSLTIYNSYTVAGLDPAGSGTHWLFDWGIAENLLQVTEDGEIEPWLAEEVKRDGDLRWVITPRTGVTFQNGKPVDAAAIAAALTRQIAKSKGAQVYFDPATAVTVEDDKVVITTPEPNAMVPAGLAARDNSLQIYDVEVMEAAAGDSAQIAGAGAYTGPYQIDSWTPDLLELSQFADYWQGTPPLKKVTVKVVPDEQARIAGVQSGEADLAFYPSTSAQLELSGSDKAYSLSSDEALQALLIEMNLKQGIFTDVAVRQAFTKAIDYAGIADQVGNGQFQAAESLYPEGKSYQLKNQKFDLAAAKKLLDKAGWVVGSDGVREKDGQRLTVRFVTQAQGPETKDVAIAVREQVAKAGFDLQIVDAEDSAAVKKDPSQWDSSAGLSGSLSGTADPVQPFLVRWTSTGSSNAQGIDNAELDEIGEKLRGEFDESKRDALLEDAQKILVEEEAYVVAGTFKYFTVIASPEWADYTVSSVRRHITFETGKV